MPYNDGTGPTGIGPTGRGFGPCSRGLRQRFGLLGYDWQRRTRTTKEELLALDEEEKIIKDELEAIRAEKKALQDQK